MANKTTEVVTMKRLGPNKRLIYGVAIVLLVVLSGIGYAVYRYTSKEKQPAATVKQEVKDQSFVEASDAINQYRSKKNYDAAVATAQRYIENTTDQQQVATMLAQVATIYEQQKKYQEAVDTYKSAESKAQKPILAVYSGIGRCAYELKDYQAALTYNNKAIEMMKASKDPHLAMDIDTLTRMNKNIEAKL